MPDSFCECGNGLVYIANGVDSVLRWDGLLGQAEAAGVLPPATAVTLGGSGVGSIVGTYAAYVRFVDSYGYVSDLSPLSNVYLPTSTTGVITGATDATPVVIESAAHGLATGAVVKITGVGGNVSANNTWAVTLVDADHFSLDGSAGTAAYTGAGTWVAGVASIDYTNIPVPSEPKVSRRQILRNTDGQATTFYVDVDTLDLSSAALSSTNDDTLLQVNEAVPLLNADGSPFANSHGVPPSFKKALAFHLGRLFFFGEITYTEGSVAVTLGGNTVQGIGTEWSTEMAGRVLYVNGSTVSYQIASVDRGNQVLTLTTPYQAADSAYASYAIRPQPAQARLIPYSEAGLPDSVPATNAISVQDNGDEIVGGMVLGSFLYVLERRHLHRFTFQQNPAADGYVFQASASRGCVNQRCWVVIDDAAFLLDEQGIYLFEGGEVQPLSEPVQDIFRRDDPPYEVNWAASDNFFATHYPSQETVRWFLCLSGHYLPRTALAYNYRLKRWWVEQFPSPVGAAAALRQSGRTTIYLGATSRRVNAFWTNILDGPDPTAGTVRGQASSATLVTLTDAAASFASSNIVGAPLAITDGTGSGQTRAIASATGQTLTVDSPWLQLPDSTSVYQIGGINYAFRSGWFRLAEAEGNSPRRVEVDFEAVQRPATFTLRLTVDYFGNYVVWDQSYSTADAAGVRSQQGSADLVCDLTKANGLVQKRLDGRRDTYADGPHFELWDLTGVSNQDEIVFYAITLDGVQVN